jgi:glycine/D-amino acid oxidase-like deaminating enzyme
LELADELKLESFRTLPTLSLHLRHPDDRHRDQLDHNQPPQWLTSDVVHSVMDTQTAQVTPLELTNKFIEASGAEVVIGEITNFIRNENDQISGVEISQSRVISCDKIVLAMGPWTGVYLEEWFGLLCPMEGIKSTSMVYESSPDLMMMLREPYACFCDEDQNECHLEIYPRPNGEVYVCGLGGSDHVTPEQLRAGGEHDSSDKVKENESRVEAARLSLSQLTLPLSIDLHPQITQACMRPLTSDGLPVIGRVPQQNQVYVCTGHNCWGILWAPISGLAISELVVDGVCTSIDLQPFQIDRFQPKKAARRSPDRHESDSHGRKKGVQPVGEQWS